MLARNMTCREIAAGVLPIPVAWPRYVAQLVIVAAATRRVVRVEAAS